MKKSHAAMAAVAIAGVAQLGFAGSSTVVTFDNGAEGWSGFGGTSIQPAGGNPGASMRTVLENFGIEFSNTTNAAFVQDLTQYTSVTFSIDLKVNQMDFFGSPVTRPWVLELRDYDQPGPDNPFYSSVFYEFQWVGAGPDWNTWSVTIDNPQSATLPAGWGGSGDVNGSFEPVLPAGVTFASILAGYDEIAFTTLEPGWAFGFSNFDWQIDNITITTVPAPGALALLGVSGLLARRRRRAN